MVALMVLVTSRNPCISIEVGDGDGISPDKGLGCFIVILLVLDGVFENIEQPPALWPVPSPPLAQSTHADGQQRGTPLAVA
jgi:hypothetical protein